MFSSQKLGIVSDVDLSKINPNMSDHDQKVEMANQLVNQWLQKKENRDYLNEKKSDYIHDKGWTKNRGLKHEVDIPADAFIMLPREIRNDRKELMKWVTKYHPELFHKRIV